MGKSGAIEVSMNSRVWRERQVPFLILDSKTGDDVTEKILS
jgi:hypothetical protein